MMKSAANRWLERTRSVIYHGHFPAWKCRECDRLKNCKEGKSRLKENPDHGPCWIFTPNDEAVLLREVLLECETNPRARKLEIRRFFDE